MILGVIAFLGGLLTILSPCILPVLPFVFSGAGQPFRKSGLPLLAGMAVTFTLVSTLAVAGGNWVIHANEWGRWLALGVLSLFALSLIFPHLSEIITRPFARLGDSLKSTQPHERGVQQSFFLGVATGFLWAPCAGPILGLILTGAAIHGANHGTTFLLLAYALGAATSLALALLTGERIFRGMKRYLGVDAWVRRTLGVVVLLGVAAIAFGLDRGVLTRLSRFSTDTLEQGLISIAHAQTSEAPTMLPVENSGESLAALNGAVDWINSTPLTSQTLRGKVVLVDFWTYSCINCLRTLPAVKAWDAKYRDKGLVIIGVHTPEFAFEKIPDNVRRAVRDLGVTYPVVLDNNYRIWNAFENQYWPAHYFIDATGKIRHHHFGEGGTEESERVIQELLAEAQVKNVPTGTIHVQAGGAEAPSGGESVRSPETYIGYSRSENQVAFPRLVKDQETTYQLPREMVLNQWGLGGRWRLGAEQAALVKAPGKIVFRFHARDLHLVLAPGAHGTPVHFIVSLDGQPPRENSGTDVDSAGKGVVREQRLYQLIRQNGGATIEDHTFEIEFLDPGAQAFAFTFG